MDFRRYETTSSRPLSSVTLDPSSSFVPNHKSRSRPSSAGTGSPRRLSRRPRSCVDLFRSRMEERRLSAPPDSTAPPPRRPRRSSTARPISFLDMSEPSRFTFSGVKLLNSTSMEGIRAGKRKVNLEVKIPDGMSSTESFGHLTTARTGSTTVGRTLNTLFLRPKRASQESGPSSPPGLFSGESAHSDSSMPPTPRTGTFAPPEPFVDPEMIENERKAQEIQEETELQAIRRIRNQFDYRRQLIPHHKFSKHEVPYMQSYSHVSLHNDWHTTDLLQHLTPNNSPTFHDFGDNPPLNVLDLGGGEGYWAAEAALFWKEAGTTVTVYDIVDLGRPVKKALDSELRHRVIFQQGNFLKSASQLPPKSFDLVRIANLTLAIPKDRWSHLLREVKRALRPGGVVEIIDDELFFPSIQPGPAPTLKHSKSLAGRRRPNPALAECSADDTAIQAAHSSPLQAKEASPRDNRRSLNDANDPAGEYRRRSLATRTLETIFQNMLQYEYGISTQPHRFLEREMLKVFDGVTVEMKEVCVAKRDLNARADDGSSRGLDTTRLRKSRHSLEDTVITDFSRPAFVAPKAAKLLQLDAGTARPYQPTGYIISPSTFVPCEPDVLEMHALHNVHVLLSCKDAIGRYIAQHRDEHGEPMISDNQFEELLSDYEDFKRRRMNWPRDFGFEEEPQSPTLSAKPLFGRRDTVPRNRGSSIDAVSVPRDAVTPVRRIRVYVGRKSDPRAMHTR